MTTRHTASKLAILVLATGTLAVGRASAQAEPRSTLYERLGGVDGIARLADALVERMAADPTLQANPYIHEAMGRVGSPGLKYRITTMLCAGAGGPQEYAGRSMHDAHAHLRITGHEWRAFELLLRAALDEAALAEADRDGVLGLIEPAMGDVVSAGELDGRAFVGRRGAGGQELGSPDEVSFADGRLVSQADKARGVAGGVYVATAAGTGMSFEVVTLGPNSERVVWTGTVSRGEIAATTAESGVGEPPRKGWFRGREKP